MLMQVQKSPCSRSQMETGVFFFIPLFVVVVLCLVQDVFVCAILCMCVCVWGGVRVCMSVCGGVDCGSI